MPLLFSCFSSSSSSSSSPSSLQPAAKSDSSSSSTTTSSSSSNVSSTISSTNSSAADDAVSIQTFPSLPTLLLHSFLPLSSSPQNQPTASFSLLFSSLPSPKSPPSLALPPTSNLLFSFTQTSISVFDLTNNNHPHQILSLPSSSSSSGSVKSAAFSLHSPFLLFTAHQDSKIRAWDFRHLPLKNTTTTNRARIRLVASLPTPIDRIRRFALPSNYVTVRRHHRRLWIEHADSVSAVAAHRGLLYSVSWDKTLKIWRISDLKCLLSLPAHDDAINAIAVSPLDGTVFTGSADCRIKVWTPAGSGHRHAHVATLERHRSAVNALAVSSDGSVLYSGACDRSILVWEREESANYMVCTGVLRGHAEAILCLWTVGMDLVVSGSNDWTVRIWRRGGLGQGYSCLCVLDGHVKGVRSVVAERTAEDNDVDDDNGGEQECYRVCSGSLGGEVKVWRVRVHVKKGSDKL